MGLTNKERYTYDIINKVITSNLTRKEAMFELNKSRQQIYRLINIYCTKGEKGLIHGNRKKFLITKKNHLMIDKLKKIYLDEYYDYNFQGFYEELTEKEKYKGKYEISYSTLYKEFL